MLDTAIRLHVWGDRACFSRPELKVERVSYDVITPSAARGILEAIHWKPAMKWEIDRIHVLKPIRRSVIRRNEVTTKLAPVTAMKAMRSGNVGSLKNYVNDHRVRAQRSTMFLQDVGYVIEARISMTNKAGERDNLAKHYEMFTRRAQKGQCFKQPSLGLREFGAYFELLEGDMMPQSTLAERDRDLGLMLYDISYEAKPRPIFFQARMQDGVIDVASARENGGLLS